jgi:Family of unknown function (DUF5941)
MLIISPAEAGMTVALVVATAAAPAEHMAASLPLLGLQGGEVTAQPLLTRLCDQLGELGVTDIILIAPPSHSGPLAGMAWDGLSRHRWLRAPGFGDAGNIEVIGCASVPDELRAVAVVARRVSAAGHAVLVCPGDLVAHTEALARLCRSTQTSALVAGPADGPAGQAGRRGLDLRPALRTADRMLVAAGSAFHRVNAPNSVGCGAFAVSARDGSELAAAADELAVLAGEQAAAPQGFTDTPALLLVGLVRAGVGVLGVQAGSLLAARVRTADQARAAAAALNAVDEDKIRLDAASRVAAPSLEDPLAACVVNPYSRHLVRWANGHRMSPNALTGIGVALGVLAALWLSAGSTAGVIMGAGFWFAAFVFFCANGQLACYARRRTAFATWLGALGGRLAEYAVYAGLAVGAAGSASVAGVAGTGSGVMARITLLQAHGVWELAVAAMILQSIRDTVSSSARAAVRRAARPAGLDPLPLDEPADYAIAPPAEDTAMGRAAVGHAVAGDASDGRNRPLRWLAGVLAFRQGARVAVIGITVITAGVRVTFLVLLGCGLVAFLARLLAFARQIKRSRRASAGLAGGDGRLVTYRDDGIMARALGRFVDGQLPPLLPAVAAVTVTIVLSVVGVATLGGVLVLAPVAVMALAALGSGNPHDGRLGWLVPAVLQLGEYVFLAALALGGDVPLPILFAVIAAISAHRYDLVYRGGPAGAPDSEHAVVPPGVADIRAAPRLAAMAALGWDGRMLAAAVGAMLGIEVFAFAVLAVYLWVLFGWDSMTGWTGWTGATEQASRIHRDWFRTVVSAAADAADGGAADGGAASGGASAAAGGTGPGSDAAAQHGPSGNGAVQRTERNPWWHGTHGSAGVEDGGSR